MNVEPTAEQIAIANLAVQFLPPIALPDGWDTEDDPIRLAINLGVPTTGIHPADMETWARFPSLATPFEILTEEAVKRARVLWAAVKGEKRPERIDTNPAKEILERAFKARTEPLRKQFEMLAGGRKSITTDQFLKIAFKGSKTRKEHRLKYLRAFQKAERRLLSPLPSKNGECESLEEFDQAAVVLGITWLRSFVERNRERLTKQWQREGQVKGGRAATEKAREEEGIIGFSAADEKRLDRAEGRAKKKASAKKRKKPVGAA